MAGSDYPSPPFTGSHVSAVESWVLTAAGLIGSTMRIAKGSRAVNAWTGRADAELPIAHDQDWLNTERESKPPHDQRWCWIPVALAPARFLAKVLGFGPRKARPNQPLTSSVLIARSQEVWRKSAEER